MTCDPPWRTFAAGLVAAAIGAPQAWAQKIVVVDDGGKAALVRAADGPRPMVERNGKLEVSGGVRFGLRDAPEYVPYIIRITSNVGTSSMSFNGDIKSLNNALNIRGTLEAPVPLENVFIALDLSLDSGKAFFLWGVGDLKAGVPADFEI